MVTKTIARADEMIRRDIIDQLNWDVRVDPANIEINVSDGQVTLSGWVPSYTARQFAEMDAFYVPGVISVINEIAVKYPALAQVPGDRFVEENIRRMLRSDAGIEDSKIAVAAALGHVTLEGTVASFWQKVRAEALAAQVNGVIAISNRLAVVSDKDVMDEVLAQNVTAALSRNPGIEMDLINVSVSYGIVTVSGSVADRLARRAVEEIVQCIDGVKGFRNNLMVDPARQD